MLSDVGWEFIIIYVYELFYLLSSIIITMIVVLIKLHKNIA